MISSASWMAGLLVLILVVITSSSIIPYSDYQSDSLEPCKNHPSLPESIICENIEDISTFIKVIRFAKKKNFEEVFLEESSIDYLPLFVLDFCGFLYLNVKSVVLSKLLEGNEMIRLKQLHLDDVTIRRAWNWRPLSVLRNLQRFSVSNMAIEILNADLVDNLSESLQSFVLTSTNTSIIHDDAFRRFNDLAYVSIQNNGISDLKRSMFPTPAKIRYFYFGKNKISSLPDDIFDRMPDLEVVGMQGNMISEIGEITFKDIWSKLTVVLLEGNPLKCNCKMLWLLKKRTTAMFKGYCYSPKKDYGKQLKDLKVSDFNCY